MAETALLVVLFMLLPALSGYVANVRSSPPKRAWYYRRYQAARGWTPLEHSMVLFIACTTALYAASALKFLGMALSPMVGLTLLSLTCLSALGYLCCYWDLPGKIADGELPLKAPVGIMTIGIGTLSKAYSDISIAELTGLPAHDLPGAQVFLTLLLTPTLWLMGISMLFGCISIPVMGVLLIRSLYRDYQGNKSKNKYASGPDITALVAVFLVAFIPLTMTTKLLDKDTYEKPLRQSIAFASFHLPTIYCGLPEAQGVTVAPMKDGTATIALPDDKLGYLFEPIACKPKQKSRTEAIELLVKVQQQESS
ncbi:hypothetical protein H2N78_28715 [Pseudomonas aeruginosa]|uniref:hypothetical protein n=1 Tax=Pseudomonas aeruginosa TaxID=287 RepID=UPI00106B2302|nr:hypothetical protein [Pseudomonas aeruginosa]MBA5121267.1 hypothetical protein [Pseudomonas aeruginosa]MCO3670547.1 hypothetical protein [Pseudomonas aeruginosa]HBO2505724.1 hypothetical protein [Pseudomonas aeruginosa]HBO9021197.1 hypothetical protein [Pseudomonas aeruginosa]HEH9492141.1 hypothetical protein [Pseudomonas aeruginosa]